MKWNLNNYFPFGLQKWVILDIGWRQQSKVDPYWTADYLDRLHAWFEFRIRGYGLDIYYTTGEGFGKYSFKPSTSYRTNFNNKYRKEIR